MSTTKMRVTRTEIVDDREVMKRWHIPMAVTDTVVRVTVRQRYGEKRFDVFAIATRDEQGRELYDATLIGEVHDLHRFLATKGERAIVEKAALDFLYRLQAEAVDERLLGYAR